MRDGSAVQSTACPPRYLSGLCGECNYGDKNQSLIQSCLKSDASLCGLGFAVAGADAGVPEHQRDFHLLSFQLCTCSTKKPLTKSVLREERIYSS